MSVVVLCCATACKSTNAELKTQQDSISWAIGESYGQSLQNSGLEIDKKLLLKALETTLDGKEQPLTQEQYQTILNDLNTTLMLQQRQKMQEQQASNEQKEEQYFAKLTQQNPNVKKAQEGFYYEVLQEGKGPRAAQGQVVTFDYRAYFATNGQLYDQTYGNRDAIRHVLGSPMFQGMQEAMQYMSAGSKYRFYFPSNKAFGPKGDAANDIPPFSTMIYEIELHSISNK